MFLDVLKTARWSRRQESNLYLPLRRRPFCPLNYGEPGRTGTRLQRRIVADPHGRPGSSTRQRMSPISYNEPRNRYLASAAPAPIICASSFVEHWRMNSRRINATPGRQSLWGRTARVPGEHAAASEPRTLRIARLLALFTQTDTPKREGIVDTVPGVMFDRE